MGNRLCEKKIEEIECLLQKGLTIKEIGKEYNISVSTVRRIAVKEYPRYYKKHTEHVEKVQSRTLVLSNETIVINFFRIKNKVINEINRIINYNNSLVICSDCYSTRYKLYRVQFLFKNCNLYFFKNLENMRIMCFKFGDFIARSVKVVRYE